LCILNKTNKNLKPKKGNRDLVIKIANKGWYLAHLTLFYRRLQRPSSIEKRTAQIAISQEYAFTMPYDVDLMSVILIADALAGLNIMTVNIRTSPECFHLWGTTLFPASSSVPCW
jgi:hypothetical protein